MVLGNEGPLAGSDGGEVSSFDVGTVEGAGKLENGIQRRAETAPARPWSEFCLGSRDRWGQKN